MDLCIVDEDDCVVPPVWIFNGKTLAQHLQEGSKAVSSVRLFYEGVVESAFKINGCCHGDVFKASTIRISGTDLPLGPAVGVGIGYVEARFIYIDYPVLLFQPPDQLGSKDSPFLDINEGI